MTKQLVSFILIISTLSGFSQDKKNIEAVRISTPPKIDGILDDVIWENIPIASDFNMWQPGNEGEITEDYKTEVKIAYDNTAVYFGVSMYDPEPDNILSQFSQRDEVFVQADLFYICLLYTSPSPRDS